MRTSVRLDDEVVWAAKEKQAKEKIKSFSALINKLLKEYIKSEIHVDVK